MNTEAQGSTYDVVAAMLKEVPPVKKGNKVFGPDTLFDSIGADSLELLELAMNLEDHFDIVIPDDQVNAFKSVGDITAYLDAELAQVEAS